MDEAPEERPEELQAREIESLVGEHSSELYAFMRLRSGAMLRAMESTSDLVQSVYREILEHRERFRFPDRDGFRRWLFATAARKIQNRVEYYRAQKRDAGRAVPLESDDEMRDVLARYASLSAPSARLRAREDVARIEAAFDRLPDQQREVITLHRIGGLSFAQVAELVNSSEAATRMQFYRGLERLAELLQEQG